MKMTAELRDHTLGVVSALDADLMTGEQAAAAIADLAPAEHALANTLMFLALKVARTNAWKGQGHASAADWLAAKVGISVGEANRLLGTAKKADRLPKTKDAMKRGDLSPDQAGAVADGATADPNAEDDLLGSAAKDTNKALKDKAAKTKAAAEDDTARERRVRSRRSLRRGTDAEGAFWAYLKGPGAAGPLFESLLRPYEELVFRQGRTDGIRDTHDNRSYDAFFAMLAHFATLTGTPIPGEGVNDAGTESSGPSAASGDTGAPAATERDQGPPPSSTDPDPPRTTAAPGGRPTWHPPWKPDRAIPVPAKLPGGNNVKVIVLIDHTALLRGHTTAGETCEIAGVGPISVAAAREILDQDPFLAVVVRNGRDIVNVAHHGRGLNAHQRTAIEAGGLRCSNAACNRTIALQIDHRVPYAAEPVTKLDNQDPLCPACHRLKTHHGWHLEPGTGPRRVLPPDRSTGGADIPPDRRDASVDSKKHRGDPSGPPTSPGSRGTSTYQPSLV